MFMRITDFMSSNFNYIALGLILLAGIYWYVKYDLLILGGLSRALKKINSELVSVHGGDTAYLRQIDRIIMGTTSSELKEIWKAYYESFRITGGLGKSGNSGDLGNFGDSWATGNLGSSWVAGNSGNLGISGNSGASGASGTSGTSGVSGNSGSSGKNEIAPDIREYFDIGSAILIPGDRKKAEAIPGILTAMGILGTFLAILIGLRGIDITGVAGDQTAISQLLSAMFSSFKIIIAAVSASVLFQVVDKNSYHNTIKNLYAFYRIFAAKIPMTEGSLATALLSGDQQKQVETLQKINTEVAEQLNKYLSSKLVPALNKSFEDSIKSQVAPYIKITSDLLSKLSKSVDESRSEAVRTMVNSFVDQLNKSAGNQLTALGTTIQGFVDAQAVTAENLNNLIKEMKSHLANQLEINTNTEKITGSITQYHLQITEANSRLSANLEKTAGFMEALSETIKANSDIIEKLNEQRLELQKENSEYFDRMNTQMLRITQDLDDQISSLFVKFTDITTDTIARLESSINLTIDGMSDNTKNLLEGMDEQSRSISLFAKELSIEVRELNSKLEGAVKEFNEHLHTGVEKAFTDFDEGLGEICGRFSRVINDIRDSVDELPVILSVLKRDTAGRESEYEKEQ